MANATFDGMWQDAMGELQEQLHVEGIEDDEENGGIEPEKKEVPQVTIFQAFQHFACLYIKYIQIYTKLEECYDSMIHPQKRLYVKNVLELVIRRILELRSLLVKWNPPNSYVRMPQGKEVSFPWEYVHLDDILVDLKLPPETLEIKIPKYFREDNQQQQEQRNRLVHGYMRLKHNTDEIYIPDKFETAVCLESMTLDRAIEIIQRNERGRQGNERAALVRDLRDKEKQNRMYDATAQIEMDIDVAATNLQRMMKGFISRNIARKERDNELKFVGMKPRKDNVELLEYELDLAYRKRKQEQSENKESYEKALDDLKDIILDEEGPDYREQLREERTLWITDQIAQDKFPTSLAGFEDMLKAKAPDAEEGADAKDAKKSGKDKKSDKKGEKADKKGKKGEKGKDKKGDPDEIAEEMPQLQSRTVLTETMATRVGDYEDIWENRDESDNFQQKHDAELAKAVVRPGVYDTLRAQVNEMLLLNLKKIQMQIAPSKKKGKKEKKQKKKNAKRGPKTKPLPGDKIPDFKDRDTDFFLSALIENQLVVRCRQKKLGSLIGEFNYLGSMHHNADRRDEEAWEPHDPSINQIRQMLCEYCILPNGSSDIRGAIDAQNLVKSIMIYGPSGTGKTHAVEAVACELGALLIHLTPEKLRGLYPGKTGPTRLVHSVMKVAMDPTMQPVVIYVDDCEQFFTGGKRNKDKEGPSRFKKDFLTYKNAVLTPKNRIIIIGTTKQPENGDVKDMRAFFDKFIYMPYPDYPSRCLVWGHYLETQIRNALPKPDESTFKGASDAAAYEVATAKRVRIACERIDVSSLALISEGYSAGAIARTIRSVVTNRRVTMLKTRPLNSVDFIDNLSLQIVTYQDDRAVFMAFTKTITGLEDRRKLIESIVAGEAEGKKDDKKGKGKKK